MKNIEFAMVTLFAINTVSVFRVIGVLIFAIYYFQMIKLNQVNKHYGGSWKNYLKDFFKTKE